MFHEVKVDSSHRDYLRFLWWDDENFDSDPAEYRMTVRLFGATSPPLAVLILHLRPLQTNTKGLLRRRRRRVEIGRNGRTSKESYQQHQVAPVILQGKRILQELCRDGLGWDDKVPDDIKTRWARWRSELPALEKLKLPKCHKPNEFGEIKTVEFHHFSEASRRMDMDGVRIFA